MISALTPKELMINWILAKLDKYKIKVIRAKFVPDDTDRSWAE